MTSPGPIFTAHLLPQIDHRLIDLLKGLTETDWQKPTVAGWWTVKDIAAHLLDTNMRVISTRDGYKGPAKADMANYLALVAYLNELNAIWVKAFERVSPELITGMLETTGKLYSQYYASADPFAPAPYPVAWAGEGQSANWFHIAREYTEKWHHQQQIRLAVGLEAELYQPEFYTPFLETTMRALPHHYRAITAPPGQCVKFIVPGFGEWFLYSVENKWIQVLEQPTAPVCEVEIEPAVAWRVFTRGIKIDDAQKKIRISGSRQLGGHILSMLAVMA